MHKKIAYLLAAAALATLVLAKFDRQTGFTGLIRFGETWADKRHEKLRDLPIATVSQSSGYDGQFYAQIAVDPLLRSPELANALDAPTYRARRILVPAFAAALGLRNAWWTLQIYALINLFCWAALGWLLYRQLSLASHSDHAFARWIGCMFSLGVLDSVRQSLVDLPALLLLTLAADSYSKARPKASVVWGALANLAKETSLLGSIALYGEDLRRPSTRLRTGLLLLAGFLPVALWSLYVQQRFTDVPQQSGLGNFTWPLVGLLNQTLDSLHELGSGNFNSRYGLGIIGIVSLVVQACSLWLNRQPASAWWRVGTVYSLLLLFLSSWVWSGYWAAYRAVLPMTIAFNLLLPANRSFWPWWIAGNLAMIHAVWRFL